MKRAETTHGQSLMLGSFRVLDLTDERGSLCGRILGDLGADVIKVERPGGDPTRNIGPFYGNMPHPERSLVWFAYNANKRGITLDIETSDGREIFKKLVAGAHFLIESFRPGHMGSLGLDYPTLCQINPSIIVTSITPFGQTGPRKHWKSSDLVAMATGGLMYLCGDPDRPPVRISVPQAYLHAGGQAAAATMIAHYYREKSGQGQHVDVSIQESLVPSTFNVVPSWELNQTIVQRAGALRKGLSADVQQRCIWQCKDGYVHFMIIGGGRAARVNRALVEWMDSEGMANEFLRTIDWESFDMGLSTQEFHNKLEERLAAFFLRHSRAELYQEAINRRIMLYPVSASWEGLNSPQLKARGFWVEVAHEELGTTILYPGAFIKSSEAHVGIRRRAPLIGEHNEEIYEGELRIAKETLVALAKSRVI